MNDQSTNQDQKLREVLVKVALLEELQLAYDMRLRHEAEQLKTQINAAIDAELKQKLIDKRAALFTTAGTTCCGRPDQHQ